jgi:hypothetical protein
MGLKRKWLLKLTPLNTCKQKFQKQNILGGITNA